MVVVVVVVGVGVAVVVAVGVGVSLMTKAMELGIPARLLTTGNGPGLYVSEVETHEKKGVRIVSPTNPPTFFYLSRDGASLLAQWLTQWVSENSEGEFYLASTEDEEAK